MSAPPRWTDSARLAALHRTELLDGRAEESFDRITRLAARLLGAPLALFTLITDDRQVLKSVAGPVPGWARDGSTSLARSFCRHVVEADAPLVIADTRAHPLVEANPGLREIGVAAYLGIPVHSADGAPIGSLCVIDHAPRAWSEEDHRALADLAAAVRTELELRASARHNRRLFQGSPTPMWMLDPATQRFLDVNNAAVERYGYARDEFLAMALPDIQGEAPAPEGEGSEDAARPCRHRRADGSWIDVLVTEQSLPSAGGAVRVAVALDVTARRRSEESLRESELTLSALMSNLPGMVYRCRNDPDWTMEYVSAGCQLLTGFAPEEYLGKTGGHYAALIHPEDRARVWDEVQAALDRGAPFQLEYRITDRWGRERWVWEQGRGVEAAEGEPRALEGFVTEITRIKEAEAKLLVSVQQQKALLNNLPDDAWLKDADGRYQAVNDSYLRRQGLAEEQVVGRNAFDLYEPDLAAHFAALDEEVMTGGKPIRREDQVAFPVDGTPRWFESIISPVHDASGAVLGTVGLSRDVTERKAAERAVRDAHEYLHTVVNVSPLPIVVVDTEHRVQLWNAAAERTFGWTRDEVLGQPYPLVPEGEAQHVARLFDRGFGGTLLSGREVRRRARDGSLLDLQVWNALAEVRGERVLVGVLADITARKEAETQLRTSEERQRMLLAQSSEAIWCASLDEPVSLLDTADDQVAAIFRLGRVTECNDAMARMYGRGRAEEMIGTAIREILPPSNAACRALVRDFVRAGYQISNVELSEAAPSGIDRFVLNNLAAVIEDGRLVRIWGTRRDITEHRMLEEQFRQSQKMEAVGRLAGGIAHDFNNVLNAIKGNVELLLLDQPADSPLREDLEEVDRAASRAAELTRQLLAFSRKQVLTPRVLDVNEAIEELQRMLRRLIPSHISMVTDLRPLPFRVRVDPGQLDQVITNLVVNARDAMPGGGTLTVATSIRELGADECARHPGVAPGRFVEVRVRDTGVGMSPEVQEQIFEPFFTTKEPGQGTGLGLSTVFGIVRQSGGHVQVESAPGQGSTFRVLLPAAELPATAAEGAPAQPVPGGGETVLVVEDEGAVRTLARRILERSGYTVIEAHDADEGLALLRQHGGRCDLLLTDMVLPRISGRALAKRAEELYPGLRVVYMSGFAGDVLSREGPLEPGAVLLQKPFTVPALTAAVRAALDAPPAASR